MKSMGMIGSDSCPCTTCYGRHINCHSECRAYLGWKAAMDKRNALRREEQKRNYGTASPRYVNYNKKEI